MFLDIVGYTTGSYSVHGTSGPEMDEWVDRWMNEWIDGWMSGKMDGEVTAEMAGWIEMGIYQNWLVFFKWWLVSKWLCWLQIVLDAATWPPLVCVCVCVYPALCLSPTQLYVCLLPSSMFVSYPALCLSHTQLCLFPTQLCLFPTQLYVCFLPSSMFVSYPALPSSPTPPSSAAFWVKASSWLSYFREQLWRNNITREITWAWRSSSRWRPPIKSNTIVIQFIVRPLGASVDISFQEYFICIFT